MRHVRAKDTVLVLTGKSRGKRGTVLSIDRDKDRALVEGVNMMKKHVRANPRQGVQGGIMQREAPIRLANLMLVCPQCGEPTRPRAEILSDGRKIRRCRLADCQAQIDK